MPWVSMCRVPINPHIYVPTRISNPSNHSLFVEFVNRRAEFALATLPVDRTRAAVDTFAWTTDRRKD